MFLISFFYKHYYFSETTSSTGGLRKKEGKKKFKAHTLRENYKDLANLFQSDYKNPEGIKGK